MLSQQFTRPEFSLPCMQISGDCNISPMGWLLRRGLVFLSYVLIDHQFVKLITEHHEVSSGSPNGGQPAERSYPDKTDQSSSPRMHDDLDSFFRISATFFENSATNGGDTSSTDPISTSTVWTTGFLICNALAIVDVLLSPRFKASTYRIRLAHRMAECNFKWCAFWCTWVLLSFFGPVLPDELLKTTFALIGTRLRLNPISFLAGYLPYALIVDWTFHWSHRLLYSRSTWWLLLTKRIPPDGRGTDTDINLLDADLARIELVMSRVALPNVWLTPAVPKDYVKYLPIWRQSADNTTTCDSECAICLERWRLGLTVCQLPCQHHFHSQCIMTWLRNDNHHCPICRRPTYRSTLDCKINA